MRAAPAAPDPALRRTLGLLQVTMSGGGVILGAGVYALIGPASGYAGAALWLSFVIAALAAGLTAIPTPASPGAGRRTRPSSKYTGVRTAGRVRGRLVDARAVPATATWAALALTTLVVAGGDLVQAAALTDAAVLGSFGLVNASLLGCRGSRSPLAGASAGSTS